MPTTVTGPTISEIKIVSKKPTLALINVMLDGDFQFPEEIPMGVGMIASYLREHGYEVSIHQCLGDKGDEEIEKAGSVDADVYGFQLNTMNYCTVHAVAEKLRERNPNSVIVLGGPFQSSLAGPILKNEYLFDCMVVGEGELTMLELMQETTNGRPDFSRIEGIVWRNEETGHVVRNKPRKLIENLDELPFLARDFLTNMDHFDPVDGGLLESIRLVTSRGCVAQCSFCSVNFYTKLQKGKIWRGRSPKNVVDELDYLTETFNTRVLNFSDSSFEDPGKKGKERTREICNLITERNIELSAKVYMRADSMLAEEDKDLLRLWKQAGIDVIIVGAEAGSDFELEFYNKRANLDQTIRTIRRLKDMGDFYVLVGFIMFGPESTMETLRQNIDFLKDLGLTDNPTQMSGALMLIRDTAVYATLRQQGRVIESENFWELPKYIFADEKAKRAAHHWDGIYARYPATSALNKNLVQLENLISRMTNSMNAHVLEVLPTDFEELKRTYGALKEEFGLRQYKYFVNILDMIDDNCSDEDLKKEADEFFGGTYVEYTPRYEDLYQGFLDKIDATGLGASGLMFKQFRSATIKKGMERV